MTFLAGPAVSPTPWRVEIDAFTAVSAQTNFGTVQALTAYFGFGRRVSTGGQNALVDWAVVLGAGTWTLSLLYAKGPDQGIYTVYIDGVAVGTIDGYAAGATAANTSDVTGIVVAATGVKTVRLKMESKNASSTSYYGIISGVSLQRTA